MHTLTEGTTSFVTDSEEHISKKMPVFYNPVMKLNRDLSLLVLSTMKTPKIALPMEASGIRAARIVNELVKKNHLEPKEICINDISPSAIKLAKKNAKHERAFFTTEDASVFLRKLKPFDYIDLDPFGTPNPFLDAATQAINKNGIIAVTATDTSALAGTYPRATARKYWAVPSRTWVMHDIGLRILIRKVQLVAAQYEKALTPILSVSADHYYRVFFRCTKGADNVKKLLMNHKYVNVNTKTMEIKETEKEDVGPLWTGELHDKKFVKDLVKNTSINESFADAKKLLEIIKDETTVESIGFLCLHELASRHAFEPIKREELFKRLKGHVARTHVSPTGFKTDLPMKKVIKLLKN